MLKADNKLLQVSSLTSLVEGEYLNGLCVVQSCEKLPTKNGGFYRGGQLCTSEGMVDYKAWSSSEAFKSMEADDCVGRIVNIVAKVNVYNGTKSLIIDDFRVVNTDELSNLGYSELDFLYSKYNIDAYWGKMESFLKKNVSDNAFKVFELVINEYGDTFKNEFAAVHHHDACRGGLLAHSLKVLQMVATLCKLYPSIQERVGMDLLCVGAILHDIGKTIEYRNGGMSPEGKSLSHSVWGGVIIGKYATQITELMGYDFYLGLLAIVSTHHGEYGEPPRTIGAYVVHLFDYLDSRLTGLNELLEGIPEGQVSYDSFKLV